MADPPKKRRDIFRRAVWERNIPRRVFLTFSSLGAWDLFVAQFLPPKVAQSMPRVYDVAVMTGDLLPWWVWLLILMAMVTISAVEYAYRQSRPKMAGPSTDRSFKASSIRMTVGEGGPYFKTNSNLYIIHRTFNLKLENIDQNKSISNCSVKILAVRPDTGYGDSWLLKEDILLAAGDHAFIPLVTYGEAYRATDRGDSFMTMGTSDGRPHLGIEEKFIITVRATALETAFCEIQCRIWVDDGQLRIEEINNGAR